MKSFCLMAAVAAQAAAFSAAKAPTTSLVAPRRHGRGGGAAFRPPIESSPARPSGSGTAGAGLLRLSPSSAAGLLVRGGAELKSYYGDALGFFGGIRIPATFLAGSSLAAMFALKGYADPDRRRDGVDEKCSRLERRAIKFYHLVSLLAFLLSLNTVVTATSAYTSVLHGRFDPVAETAYMLMKTEFEYEFVSVRWSFLTSIFCFLGMVVSRILIEFGLLRDGSCDGKGDGTRRDAAMLVACSVGALASHLLSYVNQNLWCWRSLIGMTLYLGRLVMNRAFVEKRPLQIVSVLCTLASVFYVGKLAAQDLKESD